MNRIEIINALLKKINKKNIEYLEIGCDRNQTFDSIDVFSKTGVDPKSGGNVRLTSDLFFAGNKKKYDLIFIDGLHIYEQVINDINNSIKFINTDGYILIHDLLPKKYLEQTRFRMSRIWTGDVWKSSFNLIEAYPNDFKILNTDFGVGLLKVRSAKYINPIYSSLTYQFFKDNLKNLPIIDSNFEDLINKI